jgi:hypothetical protein
MIMKKKEIKTSNDFDFVPYLARGRGGRRK